MKFLDLKAENNYFKPQIEERWANIYDSGKYLFGEQTEELETNFPEICGMKYGVSVKNATDALTIVLRYVMQRVTGYKTKVICPNFTAAPTASAIRMVTDDIHYAEIDESFTIDFSKLPDFKDSIIVPVDLFGNQTNREQLYAYAEKNNCVIIHDQAQAAGNDSDLKGHFACFSFYPTKNLGSLGDGGMICTNDEEFAQAFKEIRFYGFNKQNKVKRFYGVNSRMDEWQCAVINAKLGLFQELNANRKDTAIRYQNIIKGIKINDNCVFHQFPVLWENRQEIEKELTKENIPYMIHYPYHVCDFIPLQGKSQAVVNFRVSERILSLPIHPFLKENQVEKVEEFLYKFKEHEYVRQ